MRRHEYFVTVYTQKCCQPCRLTKRKLDDYGITYLERDATIKAHHTEVKALGYQQAPVVTVHRDGVLWAHWSGLNPDTLADVARVILGEVAA